MSRPAARITDPVGHPIPPILTGGPGSPNVLIGGLPAWRGVPQAASTAIQTAKQSSDKVIKAAEATTLAAVGTPATALAKVNEEVVKANTAASMSSTIMSSAAGADIHSCSTPLPIPPHGPGVVVNGSATVLINGLPACRMSDTVMEAVGPPNKIMGGCPTVLIGGGSITLNLPNPKDISNVIFYIHQQMRQNATGSDVAYIQDNLGIWQWDNLIPGKLDLDRFQAYKRWYDLVKGGGPWDHKDEIRAIYGDWADDGATQYNYDIWSNIHYGYVGRAAGFPEWDLLAGAGAAQLKAGTNPPGYWERRLEQKGDADFLAAFDDPSDQEAILIGIELWEKHRTHVTPQNILDAVRTRKDKLTTQPNSSP